MLLAPTRLSTITVCLSAALRPLASTRQSRSPPLPALLPSTMVIGFDG